MDTITTDTITTDTITTDTITTGTITTGTITTEAITGGPDLTGYRAVHSAMRAANEQLVAGISGAGHGDVRRAAALGRWFTGYGGELRAHHHIEDHIVFPELARRAPGYAELDHQLAADHARLDEIIDGIAGALSRMSGSTGSWASDRDEALDLAIELRDMLTGHLDVEDEQVLPMVERHFSVEEWEEADRQALKDISFRQMLFTVPWLMATLDPETAATMRADAPVILRIMWRATRGRYARLTRVAFAV